MLPIETDASKLPVHPIGSIIAVCPMLFKRLTSPSRVRPLRRALAVPTLLLATLTAIVGSSAAVEAASSQAAHSPLGIDLNGISYYSGEIPFLNVFKSNGGWVTHTDTVWDTGEENYLHLDSDGWPITLGTVNAPGAQKYTKLGVLIMNALPNTSNGNYPAGQYTVLYDGQGTLSYGGDAVVVSQSAGQDLLNVATPSGNGISLNITATDPNHTGNYLRNIRLVKTENVAALNAGQVFNPAFLNLLQNIRVLRFMDWLSTNGSTLSSWANRPVPTNAFWGAKGVPIEVAVQLANATSADAWLNIPVMADNNYITQMATLVHSNLGTSQKAYVEFSNEVWNGGFSQATYATTQGQATFAAGLGSPFDYNRNWYGMKVAQTCDIWKAAWGADAGRVVCVMGAQAANTYTAAAALSCGFWTAGAPCSKHGIGAVAIAPYFGGPVPSSWTSQSDGGLGLLFASMTSQNDPSIPAGGWLSQVSVWEAAYAATLAPYNLPLIAYEGGQTFIGFPNGVTSSGANTPLTNLYIAANRDPRMAGVYTSYFQQWKANGGQLFVDFSDVNTYDQYGEWGALESVMQTVSPLSSAPPKWQAIQNFIANNPCWWTNCVGSASAPVVATPVPMAPAGLTVH